MVQLNRKKISSKTGALAPLFDRLVDFDTSATHEIQPLQALTRRELQESISRELTLLLNTRPTSKRLAEDEPQESMSDYRLPIFFGLADFSWFEGSNDFSLNQVVRRLEEVIRRFEPRLKNPRIKTRQVDKSILGMHVEIMGEIDIEDAPEHFNFPITINNLFTR